MRIFTFHPPPSPAPSRPFDERPRKYHDDLAQPHPHRLRREGQLHPRPPRSSAVSPASFFRAVANRNPVLRPPPPQRGADATLSRPALSPHPNRSWGGWLNTRTSPTRRVGAWR